MRPMTNDLKSKIASYIKNGLDISELIKDVDIKGMDLSRATIKYLHKIEEDISGCNFSYTQLGDPDNKIIFTILRCKMSNCNFEGAKFVGKTFIRGCNARGCNFRNSDVSKVDYQHSDFSESTFCNAVITIGTNNGLGCTFPAQMFEDLCKGWNMKIKVVNESKEQ